VVPDPSLPVYAAIAPWSEKDNSYYFSLLFSVGEALRLRNQTALGTSSRWSQQQILVAGQPEPGSRAGRTAPTPRVRLPRPFEGILPILERSCATPAVSDPPEAGEVPDLVPCGTCHGLRLRPRPLPSRWVPYASTDSPRSVADTWSASRP